MFASDFNKVPRPARAGLLVIRIGLWTGCALLATACNAEKGEIPAARGDESQSREFVPGVSYTNYRYADVPWSIHVARMNRAIPGLAIRTPHAGRGVGAVGRVSEQMDDLRRQGDEPLAAVNGDFYARDRSPYSGDPRGLQIVNGDLVSAPIGGVAFWVDTNGAPHITNVVSLFRVTLPDGSTLPFGLNQQRRTETVLYTPAMGRSTFTAGGREFVLEHSGEGPWLPLRVGEVFTARVREIRDRGGSMLDPKALVLSLPPNLVSRAGQVTPGAFLKFSTATIPNLRGVQTAVSGGPALLRDGQRVPLPNNNGSMSYEFRSMSERHPRAALAWNDRYFFLIQVDGRQPDLSMGMTLQELGEFARKRLGATHAMNLDGGVSATLWADGRVRNNPCDHGDEKDVANAVAIVRTGTKPPNAAGN